ncbi:MAG: PAS domain S-box protein [Candidatus Harrisonbacteria bacterium]|nr:PAS domain S-box protein [Candidatus Harrisonbacteria bacterium]
MSIRARLVATYILVSIIPIFFVSYVYVNNSRETLVAAKLSELESVANLKSSVISAFFNDVRKDVAVSQDYYNIRHNLPILARNMGRADSAEFRAATGMLDAQLLAWSKERGDVDDIILLAPDGRAVYSAAGFRQQDMFALLRYDTNSSAFIGGKSGVFIGDMFMLSEEDRDSVSVATGRADHDFYITAPVKDEAGNFSGEIAVLINMRNLVAHAVKNLEGLGKTGEVAISAHVPGNAADPRAHAVLFSSAGGEADPMMRGAFLGSAVGLPPERTYWGGGGRGQAVDERGKDVLAAWKHVPPMNWELAVKIDVSEALIPADTLVESAWFLGIIAAFLVLIISLILSRRITDPIHKLVEAATRLSAGNFETPVAEDLAAAQDETGILARAFSVMTERLRELRRGLEQKVAEKTRALSKSLSDAEAQNKELTTTKHAIVNVLDDLRKKEGLLEQERDKLETTLRGIGEGVFVIDRFGVITFFNLAAEGISGYAASEVIGRPHEEMLRFLRESDGEPDLRVVDDVLENERVVRARAFASTLLVRKNGKSVAVAVSAAPLRDERGETSGAVVVVSDVTKEREIERAKTEFISLATHQLRTPLTTMSWIPEMLLEGALGKMPQKQRRYIANLRDSAHRLVLLINKLLDITRIESGRMDVAVADVRIARLFRDLRDDFAHEIRARKHRLTFRRAAGIVFMYTDGRLLGEILRNLIANAIKYTPNGGRIEVVAEKRGTRQVAFAVKDNGMGIPEAQQPRIFEKFFRADNAAKAEANGTGLGLYIVRQMARMLGGDITFTSREGKGATFTVVLPVHTTALLTGEGAAFR